MDFDKRLQKAIDRGKLAASAQAQASLEQELSDEELRRLHARHRLELSEYIESCLARLADHFPGFRLESVVGDRGWGAAISRDDAGRQSQQGRTNFFSRLEMTIRPISSYHVLELAAKGTIRNKEVYNRTHFQRLGEANPKTFREMIDLWVLEYAELYAART